MRKGLEPLGDKNSAVLILSTMAGDMSLAAGQYYADPRNQFWKIMHILFKEIDPKAPYKERIDALSKHRIALWDVLESSYRTGSTDKKIHSQKPNDLQSILMKYPEIKVVFLNGRGAKDNLPKLQDENRYDVEILPSSSGSNTRMTIAQKAEKWKILKKFIHN